MEHRRIYVAIVLIVIVLASSFLIVYIGYRIKYGIRENEVIILTFYPKISRYYSSYKNVSIYTLNNKNIRYIYRTKIIILISHTATLPDGKTLIALKEPPDIFTIYGINVSGHIFKALPLNELANIIKAETLVIIGCNITRDQVYSIFKGRAKIIYYYRCPAILDQVIDDIDKIIHNNKPVDRCFEMIKYS